MHALATTSALLLLLGALTIPARAAAPADTGRFVFRTVRIAGESHRYAVWLPPGHDARKRWPAIVYLNGSGECGRDGEKPTLVGLGPQLRAHPERWPFVVVFPQKPAEDPEWEECEALVFRTLSDAVRRYGVDASRVALAGYSQGGHGTWLIGARHPGRWRCLVPVCGYGRPRNIQRRAMQVPVYAFHGLRDDVVDPNDTRKIVAGLRAERAAHGLDPAGARMTLFPDANHNSWDPAFASDSLNAWLRTTLDAK